MGKVICELAEDKRGSFIPLREILEPEYSEVVLAVSRYVAQLRKAGSIGQAGEVVIQADSGLQVSASYIVPAEQESVE